MTLFENNGYDNTDFLLGISVDVSVKMRYEKERRAVILLLCCLGADRAGCW